MNYRFEVMEVNLFPDYKEVSLKYIADDEGVVMLVDTAKFKVFSDGLIEHDRNHFKKFRDAREANEVMGKCIEHLSSQRHSL
ncbi:hypothetical protein HP570_04805 [Brevibacillus sp. RS1.1]|uniref:hypothetical protein n=1 Tax=Brevibacillus sp. RS1.1 TaxID=2738982 RepID=UPI00156B6876|nr:hypothetical protein [Brevibacillus sp. RS1.1]NRR01550.1 hypothetical protein [Brevibacillus sp. RS1.1]